MVKAKLECEEALRLVLTSMNGIAAISLIKRQSDSAIQTYLEVLHLIGNTSLPIYSYCI